MELNGKVALVTGGGRRVGRALALALSDAGARVAIHYHESDSGAKEVVGAIIAAAGEADSFRADLTRDAAARTLIANVIERFGALDVLVNSAAIMERTPFGEISADQWDRIFALNLRAPFF